MHLAELAPETIARLRRYRWDRIIEKHEGPESWESVLAYYEPEFLEIDGHWVLLPVSREHHAHITILRCIPSADGRSLTIFLKDRTHAHDPAYEWAEAGFVAVCDRAPEASFFLAVMYHEWFVIDAFDETAPRGL